LPQNRPGSPLTSPFSLILGGMLLLVVGLYLGLFREDSLSLVGGVVVAFLGIYLIQTGYRRKK